ncbi:ABC transporter ATP-binding protein [Egibacter rhizosphaerae]|uniref:ABC transporter ATP-binding protein n=1 Tax=Egibacter rhizosphaerae TaxID=1670831 RepID=A0A411YLE4_9ACTN|nr:ABC transporter ATP-binding protein [Egibacter rhizosphaerae]
MLRLQGVSKTFGPGTAGAVDALHGIDLDVGRHEFVSLVGRSGCGKSTLLRLIAGLIPPTAGTVSVADEVVTGPREDVGLMFQRPALFPWRTVLENVLFPVEILGGTSDAHLDRARALLDMVGLGGFEHRRPKALSGGMQQRAALCRALVHDPDILLMDEPFAALDALTREELSQELQRIWLETTKTIVLVTHSITEAVTLSDRVVTLTPRPGRIGSVQPIDASRPRSENSPELADHAERVRRELIGDPVPPDEQSTSRPDRE